jgi:hypothetical protein
LIIAFIALRKRSHASGPSIISEWGFMVHSNRVEWLFARKS